MNTETDPDEQGDPFDGAQRRELDHLEERINLKMKNVEQKQETAYERLIGELREENAELKAWIARWLMITAGALAALLAVFEFAIG
ncbi:MAG: hypothetical protein BRD29_04890 [Bacteroidetes bacterium QH_2_67_10]|jgi:hypothetical protein|nr:MAG: hypothetical protein BRD29_04890 [Bacteroidetes bacterium QH_2_67_10]